jgi:hypothetical protein
MRNASRLFLYLCLPCLLLSLAVIATARSAANFGGDYKVIKVIEQPDNNVEVRVSLRVINNSGADVKDATITLMSTLHHMPEPTEAWEKNQTPIKVAVLHYNEHKIVAPLLGTFTIPAGEYERWNQKGSGGPNFMINYQDASGEQRHERIDLAPVL